MTLHVALTHRTSYRYDRRTAVNPQVIRLRPAPHCRTPILSYSLSLSPAQHFINWQQDPFGNYLARVVIPEKTTELSVTIDLIADMAVINPFDFFVEESAKDWPFQYEPELREELQPYLKAEPAGPRLQAYLRGLDRTPSTSIDFLCNLNRHLQKDIKYLIRMEPGVQPTEDTLSKGSGSCRDSGWLLVQIARHIGFAARFVSGAGIPAAARAALVVHAGPARMPRAATMRWKSLCKDSTPNGPLNTAVRRPSGLSTKMAPE